jgi:hypothetical protein
MARKVDEAANFVFLQFIEQNRGINDQCHPDYADDAFAPILSDLFNYPYLKNDIM